MSGSFGAKALLRVEALGKRDAMPERDRVGAGLAIAGRVDALLDFEPGTVISGFLPIRSEADVRPLMARLADRGARLCLPAIVGGGLRFREFLRGAPLEAQGYGTRAPGLDAAVLDPAIMLVPLAAFDRRRHRIGYGRGHYDRAIADARARAGAPRTVGIAFSVQEIARVPNEPHDIALDVIATESELLRS